MAKDILKEAIADAKAVREVALANAKAALEEAFTPKLQSMLSAKLSEDLNEEYDEDEKSEGMYYDEDDKDNMEEMMYDEDEADEDMKEMSYDEDEADEDMKESDLDEEIDLEEILNELELEESEEVSEEKVDEGKDEADEDMKEGKMKDADEDMKEGKDEADEDMKEGKDDEKEMEEAVGYPNHRADQVQKVKHDASDIHLGLNEGEDFDLDALLEEINNLDENNDEVNEEINEEVNEEVVEEEVVEEEVEEAVNPLAAELEETKAALDIVRAELNEVNLLNSKLLYVNRIFKANQLDEGQKLRVVETLDKAESVKEAKLIYETIKDTFNVAKSKKESFKNKTKSLKEGIGMASKTVGTTAPKKEVISESSDMMKRFQKLANIKINQ